MNKKDNMNLENLYYAILISLYTYLYMNRMIPAISIQTAERTVGETPHYAEIIEEDMILTLPQGT